MNEKSLNTWDEAFTADEELSPYLRLKAGEEHVISVTDVRHLEKDLPKWDKGKIVEGQTERKVVTELKLDQVDGIKVNKIFQVLSKDLRQVFRDYDEKPSFGLKNWTWRVKRLDKGYEVKPENKKVA